MTSAASIAARICPVSAPTAADRVKRQRRAGFFDHGDQFRLLYTLAAPHGIEQHAVGQNLIGMAGHKDQQLKFLGRQMDLFAVHAHGQSIGD